MKIFIAIISISLFAGYIFIKNKDISIPDKKNANKKESATLTGEINIKEKWDLPPQLAEVSAIVYLDEERFACVQDERGTIYIFNTRLNSIEKEIPFAGIGDYEGMALEGNTAYIVRSDGVLFEVDMAKEKSKEFKTYLTTKNNIEGLCLDKKNNRLLLAGKDEDSRYPGYKCIYAFDLSQKILLPEPVIKIDLNNELLQKTKGKKNNGFKPSDIGINPATNDIYLTDGANARLMIIDASGQIKKVFELGKDFAQPEGITFSPKGDIFISNEGKRIPGNIIALEIN